MLRDWGQMACRARFSCACVLCPLSKHALAADTDIMQRACWQSNKDSLGARTVCMTGEQRYIEQGWAI